MKKTKSKLKNKKHMKKTRKYQKKQSVCRKSQRKKRQTLRKKRKQTAGFAFIPTFLKKQNRLYLTKKLKLNIKNNKLNKKSLNFIDNLLKKQKKIIIKGGSDETQENINIEDLKEIGSGSEAVIYLHTDTHVIKVYIPESESEEESEPEESDVMEHSFKKEFDILKTFNNENIVSVYTYYEKPQEMYIMERMNLGDFDEFIEKNMIRKSMNINERLNICKNVSISIANALQYTHNKGYVHMDVKPENILCHKKDDNDIIFKLSDFGFVCNIEQLCPAVGSILYVAPEIQNTSDIYITSKSSMDIFSFGIMLYYLFILLDKIIKENLFPREWHKILLDLKKNKGDFKYDEDGLLSTILNPDGFIEIISKCLNLNPEERPSIEEIQEILNSI